MLDEAAQQLRGEREAEVDGDDAEMPQERERPTAPPRRAPETEVALPPKTRKANDKPNTDSDKYSLTRVLKAEMATVAEDTRSTM